MMARTALVGAGTLLALLTPTLPGQTGPGSCPAPAASGMEGPRAEPAPAPASSPDAEGFDKGEVQRLLEGLFPEPEGRPAPGGSVLVLLRGEVLAHRSYGLASLEHAVPFTPHHVARLPYSEGREFLVVASALMEQDGLLRLDDPVRRYFPRLPTWSEPVTLLDLIHHRSGFVDEWSALLLMHGSMANRFDRSQFLRLLEDQPEAEVEPGKGYMYSNSDYGLLRMALEAASGEELGAYMERRLFGPLGMASTRLQDDPMAVTPYFSSFYAPLPRGAFEHLREVKTSPGGAYAVATTACDLARWAQALSDPSTEAAAAVRRLTIDAPVLPGKDGHFAFGHTALELQGTPVIRHEGVLEANYLTRIPERELAVITFGNGYYEPWSHRAIVDHLLQVPPPDPPPPFRIPWAPATGEDPATVGDPARFAGLFISLGRPSWESHTEAREWVEFVEEEGRLVALFPFGRFPLLNVGDGVFQWHGEYGMQLEFGSGSPAESRELLIRYDDGYPEERFRRLEDWTPSPEALERLAGTYHSPHLDYTWRLTPDGNGGLLRRAPTLADTVVEPWEEGEFFLRLEKFPGVPCPAWFRFHHGPE